MEFARWRAEESLYVRDRWSRHEECQRQAEAQAELAALSDTPHTSDDDPEFSSDPMPAAFGACVFLGIGLLIFLLLAVLL